MAGGFQRDVVAKKDGIWLPSVKPLTPRRHAIGSLSLPREVGCQEFLGVRAAERRGRGYPQTMRAYPAERTNGVRAQPAIT